MVDSKIFIMLILQVLQQRTIGSMQIEQGKEKNSSLCIKRVAVEFDEEDLKNCLPSCTKVRLIRGTKGQRFETPAGVEDDLRRLFNGYKSFDRMSVRIQPNVHNGLIEAYVQFTDECELQTVINEINGRAGLIGAGKIRISAMAPAKNTKPTTRREEYGIDLYRLPPDLTEEHILDELKKNNLADHVAYVVVFRKKLVEEKSEAKNHIEKQQFQADLYRLMSLFYTPRTRFRSEPEVEINTATADGRVQATIIYNNPEDVGTAMKIYEDPINAEKLKFGQHKLHLVPLNHHVITLHSALVNAIEPKIRNVLETIRQMQLQNVTVNAKEKLRNEKKEMRIYIQGSDNLQMAKVRNIFNRLMKGLEFRFTDPSWVSIPSDRKCRTLLCLSFVYRYQSCSMPTERNFSSHFKNELKLIFGGIGLQHFYEFLAKMMPVIKPSKKSTHLFKIRLLIANIQFQYRFHKV